MYLSIITVTYNNLEGLKNTSESILPLIDSCEWIIIDGNSSDGTKEHLKQYTNLENVTTISEPDNGIYDAMNKGINLSRGEYLNFMNAGDSFIRESLEKIISKKTKNYDMIMYNCRTLYLDRSPAPARAFPNSIHLLKQWACIQHQSTIIRKSVFDKTGLYSLDYKYLSDYDHSIKVYLDQDLSINLDPSLSLAEFAVDGVSTNSKTALKVANEYKKIQLKYFGKYNRKLYLINLINSLLGLIPFSDSLKKVLRKLFLSNR
ncbi:glycosyltransferase [Candidatus Kapabacteria bacterium]|nr:glycosyltransferase [Candidatus Kapabacteria bacterium]